MPAPKRNLNLFSEMITAGDRLIEATKLEDLAEKLYTEDRTQSRLDDWKVARELVKQLGEEYREAIRRWRESIESSETGEP